MRSWGTYIQNPHNDFLLWLEEEVTDQSLQYFTAVYSPSSFSLLILFSLHYEHDIFNEMSLNVCSVFVFINHVKAFKLKAHEYHMLKSVLISI